ncbi:hypothetical protein IGI37_000761 [Enterococcus sp. AZ194]|uniref:hypothetical protein n=1 Tax=Enterococcus sp. AZ194 TaxID=2774629 RepID=UPI003F22F6E4
MSTKKRVIYLFGSIVLVISGGYVFLNCYSKSEVCSYEDAVVKVVTDNNGVTDIAIDYKDKSWSVGTEISDSDTYTVQALRNFPWEKSTGIHLTYTKKGDVFIRPNRTEVKAAELPNVVLDFDGEKQMVVPLK